MQIRSYYISSLVHFHAFFLKQPNVAPYCKGQTGPVLVKKMNIISKGSLRAAVSDIDCKHRPSS